jgi:hypothetical protein
VLRRHGVGWQDLPRSGSARTKRLTYEPSSGLTDMLEETGLRTSPASPASSNESAGDERGDDCDVSDAMKGSFSVDGASRLKSTDDVGSEAALRAWAQDDKR